MASPPRVDFEWDLSKENIKTLRSGRSVDQLNRILYFQGSPTFSCWCKKIRMYFERALATCPPAHKLQLYDRYIQWVEETYPSLGAASKLRNILYRCVKETCRLGGVHNHPIYVDAWLKLITYCDAPTELFNLLFHNGVGTLSAKFYISWADCLQHLSGKASTPSLKKWAHLATIFAHGLRTGAQPIVLLEDRVECFLELVRRDEQLKDEERGFEDLNSSGFRAPQQTSNSGAERKTLASLRTFELIDAAVNEPAITPSMRIGHALNLEQRGLHGLNAKSLELSNQTQLPITGLQIYRDTSMPNDLPHLPAAQSRVGDLSKPLYRLAEPVASWNVENSKAAIVRLERTAVSSLTSEPNSQPRALSIYKDPLEVVARNSLGPQFPAALSRQRGLRLLREQNHFQQHHDSLLFSFEYLKSTLLAQSFPSTEKSTEATKDNQMDKELFCDIDVLYSSGEETCFEMIRVLKDKQQIQRAETCFSLDLDDLHSKTLISEINNIILGNYIEEKTMETHPTERNDFSDLLGRLSQIIAKAERSNH